MTTTEKMTALERRAVMGLSLIMGLRMVGLFMVVPVFSLYAQQLAGATPTLIGLAMGIYGLSQALFQVPFGTLSDRIGRRPVIMIGLLLFILGSLVAAFAHSILLMLIGRTLQGMGAVGSTILALMADLTREAQRTKAMALAGMTIGLSFAIGLLVGPFLVQWVSVNGLFMFAGAFSLLAMALLYGMVPTSPKTHRHQGAQPGWASVRALLISPDLAKLNAGIFVLHAIFTATFIAVPIALEQYAHVPMTTQWLVYLPALAIAFAIALFCISASEKTQKARPFFLGAIGALLLAECVWWATPGRLLPTAFSLVMFFSGFSLLEAFLPSWVSRTAPAAQKGSALGLFSCAQFLGIFTGGLLGGWLYGTFSFTGVYLFCIVLALVWSALASLMEPPRPLVTHLLPLLPSNQYQWEALAAKLRRIPGMVEATFIAEEGMVYMKMEQRAVLHPDFIDLKNEFNLHAIK